LNGQLVKLFFSRLTRTQKDAARNDVQAIQETYDADPLLQEIFQQGEYGPADDVATRAVVAKVYGLIDDHRDRIKQEYVEKTGQAVDKDWIRKEAIERSLSYIKKEEASRKELSGDTSLSAPPPPPGAPPDEPPPPGANTNRGILDEAERARARTLRSALCLSGGGIRSATFNLGILQGLARHGLLEQFDYLSTVSGGGFIGGWLTAWIHRAGIKNVMTGLSAPPPSPIEPEPNPVNHLRVFSNYLSPRPGMLSADTWTLLATVGRNLLLTWMVFVPVLLVILMVPRLAAVFVRHAGVTGDFHTWPAWISSSALGGFLGPLPGWTVWVATLMAWISLSMAGLLMVKNSPPKHPHDSDQYKNYEQGFLILCLLPAVISAIMLALGWFRNSYQDPGRHWWKYVVFSLVIIAVPWLISAVYRITRPILVDAGDTAEVEKARRELRRKMLRRLLCATFLLGLSQMAAGTVLYFVVSRIFPHLVGHVRLYAALAVPLLILVFAINCALISGLTSSLTDDNDLEWWSRASAWLLITAVAWTAMHLLVLFAPSIILLIGETWREFNHGSKFTWGTFFTLAGQIGTVVVGVISGFVTLTGGFSAKSSSGEKPGARGPGLIGLLPSLLAPFFLGFLVILLAILTNWFLVQFSSLPYLAHFPSWQFDHPANPWDHADVVIHTRGLLLFATGLLFFVVGCVMGWFVNSNKFSLHYMWRNRIVRAYLGASRPERNPQSFTGFDENDNLFMYELREQPEQVRPAVLEKQQALAEERTSITGKPDPTLRTDAPDETQTENVGDDESSGERRKDGPYPNKLFHILNIALNLAGGDKLAWQDRKSESFTVSPLHAGSYWLGYRRSFDYGGRRGISLGTSVAISGAFVSPNMGYMMSSPVVRFLMTLFNVRFGWWLGNPGEAGGRGNRMDRFASGIVRIVSKPFDAPFQRNSPPFSVRPIFKEAFGLTDDKNPYVYLSDGGHFENLGLYEMVIRRCRFIVVCDASTDADYDFSSLAQSIRQIRVDLGVPIDVKQMEIVPPSQNLRGKYCAIGKIRYSCVDRIESNPAPTGDPLNDEIRAQTRRAQVGMTADDFDGTLIYIKASMIGDEPRDVVNYGLGSKTFPQEIIVDQWFSEAQFESYRALGSHIIDALCEGDRNQVSFAAFERKAKDHNQVNFRVFKDRISFAALAREFRKNMRSATPPVYAEKVKEFMKGILE
jgi:hypothetical protein